MFRIFGKLLLPFAVALFFFWRRFIKRALGHCPAEGVKRKLLLWLLPAALAACVFGTFSLAGILYLHFFILCALSGIVSWFVKEGRLKKALVTGLVALVLTPVIGVYGFLNMRLIRETDYSLTTSKPLTKSYTAVLVADTHYGNSLNAARLEKLCRRIEALSPDVLLLGGDIVDESTGAEAAAEIFRLFGGVKTAYGVYYVSGNHDKGTYRAGGGHDLNALCAKAGVTYLKDETVGLGEELLLAGRRDRNDRERKPVSGLIPEKETRYVIVLDHQPREYAENAAAGADLTLSGHTHAGQIFPAGFLTEPFGSELNYGITERDGMTAIVTSGASGWGFPLRTSRHSEFVCITLSCRAAA